MLLIKVDQCLNGRYVNSVYGDSLKFVQRSDYSFYKLEMNKALVATLTTPLLKVFSIPCTRSQLIIQTA